jgi:MoxR-like ATPase
MAIPNYPRGSIPLPKLGSWPEAIHEFDDDQINALLAAEAAGRPLLLRGDPGTGKSQLARAAAVASGRLFLSVVVNARTECEDLQWKFDAVARLGEAQIMAAAPDSERLNRLQPQRFLSPGPLWWALNWNSAEEQYKACSNRLEQLPERPDNWAPERGSVLLIDEIDKADTDLSNSLLETLGNGDFKLPFSGMSVRQSADVPSPLIVITTNEERELPAAFLRRCLVLPLDIPADSESTLSDFLCRRGEVHFPDRCSERVRRRAAELLWEDRQTAIVNGEPKPGQAEYLDLLRAICTLAEEDEQQWALLETLRRFVYRKSAKSSS